LTHWNVEKAGGSAEYLPRFTARTHQLSDGRNPTSIVHHLAKHREAIVTHVQRAFSLRRVGHDTLERQIGMRIEIASETGDEILEIETGGTTHPSHQPLLNEPCAFELGQEWLQYDMGEFVPIAFAVARGADENKLVGSQGPAPNGVGTKRKELKTSCAQSLAEVISEVVSDAGRGLQVKCAGEGVDKTSGLLSSGP